MDFQCLQGLELAQIMKVHVLLRLSANRLDKADPWLEL